MLNPQISSFPIPVHLNYATLVYLANLSIQSRLHSLELARTCLRNEFRGLVIRSRVMFGVLELLFLSLVVEKPPGERSRPNPAHLIISDTGVLELLQQIVNEPPPKLPKGPDYRGLDVLIERCLVKDPEQRPRPEELMVNLSKF